VSSLLKSLTILVSSVFKKVKNIENILFGHSRAKLRERLNLQYLIRVSVWPGSAGPLGSGMLTDFRLFLYHLAGEGSTPSSGSPG